MALIHTVPIVFHLQGEIEIKPGRNFPPGKLRFVIEPLSWVMAEVENAGRIRRFYVQDTGNGFWERAIEKKEAA